MATYVSNRNDGETDEQGHYRFQTQVITGNVLTGFAVKQNSPLAMNVLVPSGDIRIPYNDYAYTGWNDANATVTIATADTTNPRLDMIIAFVDRGMTPAGTNNSGMLKFIAVAGTPSGTPVEPNAAALQAAAGAGNPYVKLARVHVAAGVTTIGNAVIDDLRVLARSIDNGGWVPAAEDWSYASSTTITVPAGATGRYDIGDYVKLTQGGTVKYFMITAVTSTLLTVAGLAGVTVANSIIDVPYYSKNHRAHDLGVAAGPVWQYLDSATYVGGTVTSSGATPTLVTGLSVLANVPARAKALKITLQLHNLYLQTGAALARAHIFSGATSGALTTELNSIEPNADAGGKVMFGTIVHVVKDPTPGPIYLSGAISASASNARTDGSPTAPALILAEVA